jgi:hypothetical protein
MKTTTTGTNKKKERRKKEKKRKNKHNAMPRRGQSSFRLAVLEMEAESAQTY